MKKIQIVADQFPVQRRSLFASRPNEEPNVVPVTFQSGWIVGKSLDLQTNNVFNLHDPEGNSRLYRQHVGPIQHPQAGTAKCMKDIDASPIAIGCQVVGHILGTEGAFVAEAHKNPVRLLQVPRAGG